MLVGFFFKVLGCKRAPPTSSLPIPPEARSPLQVSPWLVLLLLSSPLLSQAATSRVPSILPLLKKLLAQWLKFLWFLAFITWKLPEPLFLLLTLMCLLLVRSSARKRKNQSSHTPLPCRAVPYITSSLASTDANPGSTFVIAGYALSASVAYDIPADCFVGTFGTPQPDAGSVGGRGYTVEVTITNPPCYAGPVAVTATVGLYSTPAVNVSTIST